MCNPTDKINALTKTLSLVENLTKLYVCEISDTIALSDSVKRIRQDELSKLPFHINVIESAVRGRLRETGHSRILVDLLQHPVLQRSFVKRFLDIDLPFMQVDREIGSMESHIDVALYDENHFIIVENKVNDAEEQPHQVYRYVHDIGQGIKGMDIEDIYVIYLNSRSNTPPDLQSLCNGDPDTDVRKILNDRFVVGSFADDIIDWLQDMPALDEPFMQSAIHQYLDYLQRYFETTNEYKEMKEKIKQAIAEGLDITPSMTAQDRINRLQEQLDSINVLKENIEIMLNQAQLEHFYDVFKSRYPEYVVFNNLTANPANFGIQIPYKDFPINVHLELGSKLYFGVMCDPTSYPKEYELTRELLSDFYQTRFNSVRRSDNVWPVWEYTDFSRCEDDLEKLIKFILEK